MKCLALLVAASLAAGCTDDDGEGRPLLPQESFPTKAGGPQFFGRVCIASDLRNIIVACTSDNAGGLRVVVGNAATLTASDGTFVIATPTVVDTVVTPVTVSGTTNTGVPIVATTSVFGQTATIIPAVNAAVFDQMLAANSVVTVPGTGSILTQVTSQAGVPIAGVAVTSNPTSQFGPFFDAGSPVTWGIGRTGALGMVWVPAVTVGSVDLSFQSQLGGIETTINGIQVHNGGITVLDATLPIP